MKRWLVAPLAMLSVCGFAAEVEGRISFTDNSRDYDIKAGFIGKDTTGKQHQTWAGTTCGPTWTGGKVTNSSFKPITTMIEWKSGKGCAFRHSNLPPGKYMVYAKWGERYLDWKVVDLKTAKSKVKLNFTIDPKNSGGIEVLLPKKGVYRVTFTPVTANGKLPVEGVNFGFWLNTEVEAKNGKAVALGLRAGTYNATVEELYNIQNHGGGSKSYMIRDFAKANVIVNALKQNRYALKGYQQTPTARH